MVVQTDKKKLSKKPHYDSQFINVDLSKASSGLNLFSANNKSDKQLMAGSKAELELTARACSNTYGSHSTK